VIGFCNIGLTVFEAWFSMAGAGSADQEFIIAAWACNDWLQATIQREPTTAMSTAGKINRRNDS